MAEQISGLAQQIKMIDSTQREGYQSSGIDWGVEDSIALLQLTSQFGVDTIELTHPGSAEASRSLIERARNEGLVTTNLATHVRTSRADILSTLDLPVDIIHTYVPIDIYGDPRGSILRGVDAIESVLPDVQAAGKQLRVSAEHSFRLPEDLLQEAYSRFGQIKGIARVGLAETTGMVRPSEFRRRLRLVLDTLPRTTPIGVHIHNDNGTAGGKMVDFMEMLIGEGRIGYVDAVIGGGGERNGINSWGDFLAAMYDFDPSGTVDQYNLPLYAHILRCYSGITGEPLSRRDPLNAHAFAHKAGPHLQGVLEHPDRYQIIPPEQFGHTLHIEFGSKITGWYAIQYFASDRLGLQLTKPQAAEIARHVRATAFQNGSLSDDQLSGVICENAKQFNGFDRIYQGYDQLVAQAA